MNKDERLITNIISSIQDSDGIFKIMLPDGKEMPLNQLLGQVANSRGTYTPLGMSYNPLEGIRAMVMSIYISVPIISPLGKLLMPDKLPDKSDTNPDKSDINIENVE